MKIALLTGTKVRLAEGFRNACGNNSVETQALAPASQNPSRPYLPFENYPLPRRVKYSPGLPARATTILFFNFTPLQLFSL